MKKIFILFSCFLLFLSVVSPASAVYYDETYPDYLEIKGCVFYEGVTSGYGLGSLILPHSAQSDSIAFGRDSNIYNITASTISGYFITSSGVSYSARLTSFGSPEIRTESTGAYYNWVSLNFEALQATNIYFVDFAGTNTQNDKPLLSNFEIIIIALTTGIISAIVVFFIRRH